LCKRHDCEGGERATRDCIHGGPPEFFKAAGLFLPSGRTLARKRRAGEAYAAARRSDGCAAVGFAAVDSEAGGCHLSEAIFPVHHCETFSGLHH
jgi:hypothetical protein